MFNKNFFPKGTSEDVIKKSIIDEGYNPQLVEDEPNFVYETHVHPETKLIVCLKGLMTVKVKEVEYKFEPGDKLKITGNTPHSGVVGPKGCTYFWAEKLI